MRTWFSALVLVLVLAPPTSAQSSPGNALPPGEGRELLATGCSQCHGLNTIMSMRDGPAGWTLFVYDMILRGAQLNPREAETVVNYLIKHFGPGVPPARTETPAAVPTLPPGAGRALIESRCTLCHGVDRVVSVTRTAADWESIVKNMAARGATVPADEVEQITKYLNEHFGK
jgi:mono/diheme cytochrome c family protein